ncbi:ABC transporter substrate-binding protein [Rhodobacteraceae bacterium F11138]|nr:ABC transporter substrate-binding protein [Rhodobacteraceae bacterium F11138]
MHLLLCTVLTLAMALSIMTAGQAGAGSPQRIVSLGGSVTEIVYALDQQDRLVARDTTSNYPAAAQDLPDVGYIRRLSPEGLLSVEPDLILAEDGAGPPETLDLLRASRIPLISVPMGFDRDAVKAKITAVAEALGVPARGAELAQRVTEEIDLATRQELSGQRVLFILTLQDGRVLASGTNTAADGIMSLAGAVNAVEGFEGYKLLTDEAILTAAPDVILMMQSEGARAVSDETLFSQPAIAATPAGQNRAVLRMDGMFLLGFSVRTGQAVTELAARLHGSGS